MTKITTSRCIDERGRVVPCDSLDDTVAFSCPRCSHPMLAVLRDQQRGSSPHAPAICRKCGFECWLEVKPDAFRLYGRSLG